MRIAPALRQAAVAFACCFAVVAAASFLERSLRGTPVAKAIEWTLWPGVALWFGAGGTFFGGGFGTIGDFLIIVAGSAAAWSIVVLVAVRGVAWLRHRMPPAH